MANTTYGDISPRTAAFVVKDLMKRGMPYLIFEKFGQAKPIPTKNTKTISFRRYFLDTNGAFDSASYAPLTYFQTDAENNFKESTGSGTSRLTEGVTPDATKLESKDITATLVQYGGRTTITDVVMDTHEDNVLREAVEILGEAAAIILEKARIAVTLAGTNVVYANGSARTDVNTKFSKADQNKAIRTLKRQLAKPITQEVRSTPSYGTEPIAPAFVAICHPDLEYDISAVTGFVPAEKYGQTRAWDGEIGKIGDVRYIVTTLMSPWEGGGTSGGTNMLETSSDADVYPILYLARDAYGLVPLKGKDSITPMVVSPKPSDSDPLAQRGHVSWKSMTTTIILNDAWMVRAEVGCTDDDNLA